MSEQLIDASAAGDFDTVRTLVAGGANLNFRGSHGNTALAYCLGERQLEIQEFLLANGADSLLPGYFGHSAVGLRAFDGHAESVKLLLSNGADPNQVREETGETPLHLATAKGNLSGRTECVKALLEAGADPNILTKDGVVSDCFYDVTVFSEGPLHWAAAYGDEEMVEALIRHGADTNQEDGRGELPSAWAGRHWRSRTIRALLQCNE